MQRMGGCGCGFGIGGHGAPVKDGICVDGWAFFCRRRLVGLARFGTVTLGGVIGLVMNGGVMMRGRGRRGDSQRDGGTACWRSRHLKSWR